MVVVENFAGLELLAGQSGRGESHQKKRGAIFT